MDKNNSKAWLYLLPAMIFLGVFMIYPLFDVIIYSVEEGYNFASQTYFGIGDYNFAYVLRDTYFQLDHETAGLLPDSILPALRHQYAGSRPGIHDPVQEDPLFRRFCEPSDHCGRRHGG